MKMGTSMDSLTSPRLRHRRLVRVYFFPWSQAACVTLLALFGWRIKIPLIWLFSYWVLICLCCIFIDLAAAQSRIMRFVCLTISYVNRIRHKPRQTRFTDEDLQVFFTCPAPPFLHNRHAVQWGFSLAAVLLTWGFAVLQVHFSSADNVTDQLVFTLFLFVAGIISYAMFTATPTSFISITIRRLSWYALVAAGALSALLSLRKITEDIRIILFGIAFFIIIYATIFATQRLWAGQKVLGEVIRDISLEFLQEPQTDEKLTRLPEFLATRLKFDRVFILIPATDEQTLKIVAESGDYPSVMHQTVPVLNSLTGKAFLKKKSVVWNDVDACPYYCNIHPADDTKAEIAVPILYQGVVYGILDVQTKVKGAYSLGDLYALETIARIMGAAIAADKREQFYADAVSLWEHVMSTHHIMASEQDVFEVFAQFACEQLQADPIIYYPLSLAGYPVRSPYTYGDLNRRDLLHSPLEDPGSSLVGLVADWEPYFETHITPESRVARFSTPDAPGFVEREAVQSTCFLPVGSYHERLGALFLNFRRPQAFDESFKFAVLSLAQLLAQVTAQVRYRDVVYHSFGRPELDVHSLLSRYGYKSGIIPFASQETDGDADDTSPPDYDALYALLNRMDKFVEEIRLTGSAGPPDFWVDSLQEKLEDFKSALPVADGRRPRLKLEVDPLIETEYPLVKLALYRLITESVSNAIFHGHTNRIEVAVQRDNMALVVQITNDGLPLPPDASGEKSKNGIYMLLHECDVKLGAVSQITNRPDGTGVLVCVSIPVLPLKK